MEVEAHRELKRSHSLEMIDIIDPDNKNLEEFCLFDEDNDEIAGLLHSKARKKTKYMTTESVCRIFIILIDIEISYLGSVYPRSNHSQECLEF